MEGLLAAHLAAINAPLDPHQQLSCLVVISELWTVENGFITPTFTAKRNRVEEVYGAMFERWEAARQPVLWFPA